MITLGHNRFDVPTPPAMRSFALQQRILPVAGRLIGAVIQAMGLDAAVLKNLSNLLEVDILKAIPAAGPALAEVFAAMPPNEIEVLTRELLRDAKFSLAPNQDPKLALFGSKEGDAFDGIMQGRTWDTWKLLAHALEVWYPDFFARARALTARKEKAKPSEVSSTSPTPGPSSA